MREADSFIHSRIENMVNQGQVEVDETCRRKDFSRYLTGPIETEEQKNAFQEIIEFFDNVPDMTIPIHLYVET